MADAIAGNRTAFIVVGVVTVCIGLAGWGWLVAPALAAVLILFVAGAGLVALCGIPVDTGKRKSNPYLLAEALPDLVWGVGTDGRIEYANRYFLDYCGYSLEQINAQGWDLLLHPDDVGRAFASWWHGASHGETHQAEIRYRRHDGQYRWFLTRSIPVEDEQGRFIRWLGAASDIEDRKRNESSLLHSERRYRALVRATPQVIWSAGSQEKHGIEAQVWWQQLTGQTEAQAAGWGWLEAVHFEDRARVESAWKEALETRSLYECEYRVRAVSGDWRYLAVRGVSLLDGEGGFVEWIGSINDITEQKLAERLIHEAKDCLETAVLERTAALEAANVRLRREFEERRQAQEKFRILFEYSSDAYLLLDEQGIIDCNPATVAMLRCRDREAVLDLHLLDLSPEFQQDGRPSAEKYAEMDSTARKVGGHRFDWLQCRTDGELFPCEITLTPVPLDGRDVLLVVWHDLTERQQAADALRLAKESAEHSNRAKSEFLANVSHEIRTPMNGILGMTELTLDTDLDSEQREYLQSVKSSAESLLGIINDILDFSKIEAGKLTIDPTPFVLRKGLLALLDPFELTARLKGLELVCTIASDIPDELVGDFGRIRQVLINLIGNAIKFTASGQVTLEVRMQVTTRSGAEPISIGEPNKPSSDVLTPLCFLQFAVTDTGIGIPADKLTTIFKPFEQADGSMTRRYGGTGLGLTISSRLAELLGGKIWVESEVGKGTTFHFQVRVKPKLAISRQGVPIVKSPSSHTGIRPLKILLAEDNVVNQRLAVVTLQKQGHRVVVAGNGREAVEALDRDSFDVILMDVQMPEMDGLEATAAIRIKEEGGDRYTPIIALTAHAMQGDRERFLDAGMDGYVSKPLRPEELWKAIAECVPTRAGAF